MAMNFPRFADNKKLYYGVGSVAAGYVAYRWWTARSAATEVAVSDAAAYDTGSQAVGGGGAFPGGMDVTPSASPATNTEWTAYAAQELVYQGWDGMTVQAALGKFLTHAPVTVDEENIIRAAIGVAGNPPQGTFEIVHAVTTTPVDTPAEVKAPAAPGGFYNNKIGPNYATVGWKASAGATHYDVYREWTKNSSRVATPTATFTGLKSKTTYRYKVRAINSAGISSWSATQWFRTT